MMANPYGIFPTMPTNSSTTLLCAQCKKFFTYMDSVVLCDGACKRWYHSKCAKLPENKYRVIQDRDENRSLGLKCMWACKDCRDRPDTGRDPEFESYVRERLGKLSQVLEYLVTKIQDIENRQKSQEVDMNKETGDALYNFTGNFAGASAGAQGQGSSNAGLKEAMECHYGDCKCIKQESHGEASVPKPCSGKHCNCTCKTHKIVMATKKENVGKIHKCPHCDFTSKRSDNVKRHMLRHTGERPHKCPHCDFSAKRPHSLKKHIENIHNKDLRGHELIDSIHNKDLRAHGLVEDIHNKDLRADGIVR